MKSWVIITLLSLLLLQDFDRNNASLAGVVVRAGSDTTIEAVRIQLKPIRLDSPSRTASDEEQVSDNAGRFEFRDLAPGRYRLSWSRDGYFPPAIGFRTSEGEELHIGTNASSYLNLTTKANVARQFATRDARIVVQLTARQRLQDLVLPLVSGSTISGRVLDVRGQPLVNAKVTALRITYEKSRPVLTSSDTSAMTDDRGDFRLFALSPGQYYVRAELTDIGQGAWGRYSYYPGVSNADDARPITLEPAGEYRLGSFNMPRETGVKVSGAVVNTIPIPASQEGDEPLSPTRLARRNVADPFHLVPVTGTTDPDRVTFYNSINSSVDRHAGKFELSGVQPGDYDLYALLVDFSYVQRLAWTRIHVGAEDVNNVSLTVDSGRDLEGRIVFIDGASAGGLGGVRVLLRPYAPVFPDGYQIQQDSESAPEGTFQFSGVPEMQYTLWLDGRQRGAAVTDIRQGGQSVFDSGFFVGMKNEPIEVIVSGDVGSVQVTLKNAKPSSVADAVIALVPAKERRGNPALYRRAEFDALRGQYLPMNDIPSGEYKLFAWDIIPDDAEQNAEFLREFEDRGVSITVRRNQTTSIELPVISLIPNDR